MKSTNRLTNRNKKRTAAAPQVKAARICLPGRPRGSRKTVESAKTVEEPVSTPKTKTIVAFSESNEPAPQGGSRGDTLELYLREIGRVNLLTPAEEVALARRIRKGDEAAREHMIKANLRLVVKIARDYEGLGLPLLDLINEGNIGLMKGVERFDPDKGAKLSTYSSWWIKQAIRRALAQQGKTIRLPDHVVDKVTHIHRAEIKLRDTLRREPTEEELAAELGTNPRRLRMYRDAARAPVSLDSPLGSDDDAAPVADVVADPNAAAPFDHLVKESDSGLVREVFETLSERERKILAMRFGLGDDEPRTLEEIGEHFGVTRERIRQIQEGALKVLRRKMEKRDRPVDETAALAA